MTCAAPEDTDGGTFSCAGSRTDFGDTCHLDCHSHRGYKGDAVIICNSVIDDTTVSWSSIPTCTGKPINPNLNGVFIFVFNLILIFLSNFLLFSFSFSFSSNRHFHLPIAR